MTHPAPSAPPKRQLTDLGNAELFVELHSASFRYVRAFRRWHSWNDVLWRPDETGEADRAAKETVRELLRRAADINDETERKRAVNHALASQAEPRLRALLALAATEPEMALRVEALDADPFLLTCPNGTLDLRTGCLVPHRATDLISRGTNVPYDPNAAAPRWNQFLLEVFDGDMELIEFIQRAVGYSLSGDTSEQVLFVCHGDGANGKSVFREIISCIAGDHATTASFDSFLRSRGDRGPRNDIARLHLARLVSASESGPERRLEVTLVKELTGGDTIAARYLYGEYFEFKPRFKIWLFTNHRPRIDDDPAMWRRLRLVPFAVSFEGREDRQLVESLRNELPGVLAWAVEGALRWQKEGLGLPGAIEVATSEYREAEDTLGTFLEERCAFEGSVDADSLRRAFDNYCEGLGESSLSASALGRALSRRGVRSEKRHGKRRYRGVRLLLENPDATVNSETALAPADEEEVTDVAGLTGRPGQGERQALYPIEASTIREAQPERVPIPGDPRYIDWLETLRANLTVKEWREQRLLHFALFRLLAPPDPRGEKGLLSDLVELGALPVAKAATLPLCRYPSHRAAGDWQTVNGHIRCRICHPPVGRAEQ